MAVDLGGREILVVDDVRFTRLTLVRTLQALGSGTVHEAADGAGALALLQSRSGIGCVITDIEMPHLDGLGLLQSIRSGAGGIARDLRVVILTGHADFDRLGPALLLAPDAFLPKPISRQALERCLERLLAPAEALRESAALEGDALRQPDPILAATAARPERRLPLADLPPDSVLSRDLLFSNGRLLLPAGTRLNPGIVQRLAELLPLASITPEAWIAA